MIDLASLIYLFTYSDTERALALLGYYRRPFAVSGLV